eukprot:scaffold2962_cov126-Cylindrotheca_fusiformis.AAC.13
MSIEKQAPEHLKTLLDEIENQSPKTLSFWRVSHEPIVKILSEFAETDGSEGVTESMSTLLPQVQTFFDDLNSALSSQEAEDPMYQSYKQEKGLNPPEESRNTGSEVVSVVFGGKFPKDNVHSISEGLVRKLAKTNFRVYTVSRSSIDYPLPSNLVHIPMQNLDSDDTGTGSREFMDVMQLAAEGFKAGKRVVFYMTLGQHKGDNPFSRNMHAAQNFCFGLLHVLSGQTYTNWQVVLTGTDATLPSDHNESNFTIHKNEFLVIPSYKILKYNFVYAMSKLGQYYQVANAIAHLTDHQDIITETEHIIAKIKVNVEDAGENGNYQPPSPEEKGKISMEELDEYSRRIVEIEKELHEHFVIAMGISICYTPLHAKPWTEKALSQGELSPKAFVLEQVVKRLKNAISIDQAVECHFS